MKRALWVVIGVLAGLIVLPPIWFTFFPGDPSPSLPPPGERIELPDGTRLNVLVEGEGAPVVLVHGLPGSAYDWRLMMPEIASRGMRAIAYDRVGYGRSDPRANGTFTTGSNADELIGLLEVMDLRDATIVGWSYGGATAMTAAMRGPERIARIVLVGTGGPDSDDAEVPEASFAMRFFYSDAVLHWRNSIPPVRVGLMRALSEQAFSGGPQPAWWLDGLRANFARWETIVTFREEMFGMTPESVEGFDLEKIRVPTLLIHGDEDRLASIDIARYLAPRIENARLIEVRDASHMLPITHSGDVAEEIVSFVR